MGIDLSKYTIEEMKEAIPILNEELRLAFFDKDKERIKSVGTMIEELRIEINKETGTNK